MKKRKERASFTNHILSNANLYGKAFGEYQQLIADAYFDGEIDIADEEIFSKFNEELYAFICGDMRDRSHEDLLRGFISDYDAVKDAVYDFYSKMSGFPKEEMSENAGETIHT